MIRLAIRVGRRQREIVLAELLELSPSGVEEVELPSGDVEYALYGAPGELPALPDVEAAVGTALVQVSSSEIADDWEERWRDFHKPLVLGDEMAVRPPWSPPASAKLDLVIDPAQAFGTGSHATTRLCLELMLSLQPEGGFLDLGSGSGVLAIAAAALGWHPVLALDNDRVSVATTEQNAAANGVELEVRRADVRDDPLPGGFSTVAANLSSSLLCHVAKRLPRVPVRLIASGLLEEELGPVTSAFTARGMREREQRRRGGWAALLLCGV